MANKASTEEVTYEVIRVTHGIRFCPRCGGSGTTRENVYHNQLVTGTCPSCKGTGRTWVKHETRIPLIDALKELKLINS